MSFFINNGWVTRHGDAEVWRLFGDGRRVPRWAEFGSGRGFPILWSRFLRPAQPKTRHDTGVQDLFINKNIAINIHLSIYLSIYLYIYLSISNIYYTVNHFFVQILNASHVLAPSTTGHHPLVLGAERISNRDCWPQFWNRCGAIVRGG